MSVNNIKGFDKLSQLAKSVFVRVYVKHRNGLEDKEDWIAVEVKERKDHVEVHFKNGTWLHYTPRGEWY